jgi:filamentous hemagglutinin
MTGHAEIKSGGKLNIEAGKTFEVKAADVTSAGDANIKAKDIKITTVELENNSHSVDGNKETTTKSVTNVGSNVNIGGNLKLETEKDTNIEGSNFTVGGSADLNVGGDLNIVSKEDTYESETNSVKKEGKKTTTTTTTEKAITQVSSNLSVGGNLKATTGNDMNIEASNVAVRGNADLNVGGDLNVVSRENTYESSETTTTKKKGTAGIGNKTTTESMKESAVTQAGSNFLVGGNLKAKTGDDINIEASNVMVGGNADIDAGGDINVISKEDTYTSDYSKTSSKTYRKKSESESEKQTVQSGSSIQAGGNLKLKAEDDITLESSGISTENGNINLDAGNNVNILAKENTYEKTSSKSDNKGNGIKQEKTDEHWYQTKLQSSSISSGKDLKIDAGQDITLLSSNVEAKGDAELNATNVNVLAGIERDEYSYTHTKKGLSSVNFGALVGMGAGSWKKEGNQMKLDLATYKEKTEYHGYANETAKGSNIGVGGNLKVNANKDINVIGSNIAADSADIGAGGNITVGAQETHQESWEGVKETTIKVGVAVGNAVADAGKAVKDVSKAEKEVEKAKKALEEAKKDPKMSERAKKDLEANLAAATVRLAGATQAAIQAGVDAASSSATLGFYGTGYQERNTKETRTETNKTTNLGSSIVTRNNLNMKSGNDINQKGSTIGSVEGNVNYDAQGDITIEATQDTASTTTTSSTSKTTVTGKTTGTVSASHSEQSSKSASESVINNNSVVIAQNGNAHMKSGDDIILRGANVVGKTADIETGGDLTVESLQNTYTMEATSKGSNVGYGSNGVDLGYNEGHDTVNRAWVDNATTIQTTDNLKIKTNDLNMKGSVIASETNNLDITASKINSEDIQNIEEQSSTGFGVSVNYGEDEAKGNPDEKRIHNSATISVKDTGSIKEGVTHSTIGNGNINLEDTTGLDKINRDLDKTNEVTREEVTGALDATVNTNDLKATGNMLFDPGDTAKQMVKDIKKIVNGAVKYGEKTKEIISSIGDALGLSGQDISENDANIAKGNVKQLADFLDETEKGAGDDKNGKKYTKEEIKKKLLSKDKLSKEEVRNILNSPDAVKVITEIISGDEYSQIKGGGLSAQLQNVMDDLKDLEFNGKGLSDKEKELAKANFDKINTWLNNDKITDEEKANAISKQLCVVVTYYLYAKCTGQEKRSFTDFYMDELSNGNISAGKDGIPNLASGSGRWDERYNLTREQTAGGSKPVTQDMVDNLNNSDTRFAINNQDTNEDGISNHTFLIAEDESDTWRNCDQANSEYEWRGGKTNWDKVYRITHPK